VAAAERQAGLPSGVLLAIGFGEAGRRVEGGSTIWPWTVNVEGEGRYFASKRAAIAFVEASLAAGRRSIDVGCMQINLRWHPQAFADLEAAFDPMTNAGYAARFLGELRARIEAPGLAGWLEAIGLYHSGTPEFAERYRAHVGRYWAALEGAGATAPDPAIETTAAAPEIPTKAAGPGGGDPMGMGLVAYWAGPFGIAFADDDPFGMKAAGEDPFGLAAPADRPPLAEAAGKAGESAQEPRRPRRAAAIRRFHGAPQIAPARPLERRPGLLLQQSAGS
jgi:hypothetical protein